MSEIFNYFLEKFLLWLGIVSITGLTIYGVIEHGVVVLVILCMLFGTPVVLALLMTMIKYRNKGGMNG